MYRKIVNALYILNILFQSLLVNKCSAPTWLYAPLGVFGAIVGFISMCKFIISACESLERLEKERAQKDKEKQATKNNRSVES